MKPLYLQLSEELHKKLKIEAIKQDISMKKLIEKLIKKL